MRVVGRNPVGARIRTLQRGSEREPGPWHEIVGVVSDLWTVPADWSAAAYIYRAASSAKLDPVVVAVRVAGDARRLRPASPPLRGRSMRGCSSGTSSPSMRSSHRAAPMVPRRRRLRQRSARGGGLLCGRSVRAHGRRRGRRTREIGIRIALGANPRRVLASVFARAGRQLGGGIIAGNSLILLLAWRADSLTADLLVSSVITSVIMAAVGVLACAAPARRALRVQPIEALRQS